MLERSKLELEVVMLAEWYYGQIDFSESGYLRNAAMGVGGFVHSWEGAVEWDRLFLAYSFD